MMNFDVYGLPVDSSGSAGDTSMRAGMLAMCMHPMAPHLSNFEMTVHFDFERSGLLLRHPRSYPWDNPWNFTRDQLLPMLAGLKVQKETDLLRRVFVSHALRGFFCQDVQEDKPGSWKTPPNGPDMLAPQHIGALVIAGKIWPFYPFLPIAVLFLVIDLFIRNHDEQNQTIAMCSIYGKWALWLYKQIRPDWDKYNVSYWTGQNQLEYADMIREYLK